MRARRSASCSAVPTPQSAEPASAVAPRPKNASGVAAEVITSAIPMTGVPSRSKSRPRIGEATAATAIATANQTVIALEPESDQREVDRPGRDERSAEDVAAKSGPIADRGLVGLGARDDRSARRRRRGQGREREQRRDQEHCKAECETPTAGDSERDDQRPERRADLIECLVESESAAAADARSGFAEDRGDHRPSNTAPEPFTDHESRGGRPASRERERRDAQHIQEIADPRVQPILPGPMRDCTRDGSNRITREFAAAGHRTDRDAVRTEMAQECADDAAAAFVRHIGEQIDDPHEEDETERSPCVVRHVSSSHTPSNGEMRNRWLRLAPRLELLLRFEQSNLGVPVDDIYKTSVLYMLVRAELKDFAGTLVGVDRHDGTAIQNSSRRPDFHSPSEEGIRGHDGGPPVPRILSRFEDRQPD